MKIHIINGPNLNMLGKRESSIYGSTSLADIEKNLSKEAEGHELTFFQSNSEGALVDNIHENQGCEGIIINAGAYTHTSVAIRDALLATRVPFVEVHISNVYQREEFRHKSLLSDIAGGIIVGMGIRGYSLALQYFLNK